MAGGGQITRTDGAPPWMGNVEVQEVLNNQQLAKQSIYPQPQAKAEIDWLSINRGAAST